MPKETKTEVAFPGGALPRLTELVQDLNKAQTALNHFIEGVALANGLSSADYMFDLSEQKFKQKSKE